MKFKIETLESVNTPNSIHDIYPYRGKISAIDASQVLSQMPRGSIVLDPFLGSGTIVYEGLKYGLNTIGIDANPLAVLLTKGKINIPANLSIVEMEVKDLIDRAKLLDYFHTAPDYPASLFHIDSMNEIMRMSTLFDEMSDYVKACFVGAIIPLSKLELFI